MFDAFQMAIYLATRSLVQLIPCLLNIPLCFSESRAYLRVGGSSMLEKLPISLSNVGSSLWSLTEKFHIIQQMHLFKRCILLYEVTSFFLMEYQGGVIRIVGKACVDSVSVSVIDWQHALGMLREFHDAQFIS